MSQMLAEVVFVSRLDLRLVVEDQNILGVFFFGGAGEIEAAGEMISELVCTLMLRPCCRPTTIGRMGVAYP